MERTRPKIIIADDHTLVAEACKKLLEAAYDVVATVGDVRAPVRVASSVSGRIGAAYDGEVLNPDCSSK